MTDRAVFSTFTVDKSDKAPDAQLVRATAKWRRDRNLDDSYEHMHASTMAVLRENPRLAREYYDQPKNFAQHGEAHFSKLADLVEDEE